MLLLKLPFTKAKFSEPSNKFSKIFSNIRGHGKISESNIEDALRDVRRALLEADVNYKVVKSFIDRVKSKAKGDKVFTSITPGQQFIKLLKDELTYFLGDNKEEINFSIISFCMSIIICSN